MSSAAPAPKKDKKAVFFSRLLSTLIMWALVTTTFVSGDPWAFIGLVGLLAGLCFFELLEMSGPRVSQLAKITTGVIGVLSSATIAYSAITHNGQLAAITAAGLAIVILLNFAIAMRREPNGEATLIEVLLPVSAYLFAIVMFFGATVALLFLSPGDSAVPGAWLVLACVAITKFSDMGAYLTGMSFGKKKMIPHISPGKTWAGLFGAMAFPLATACAFYGFLGEKLTAIPSWGDAIVIGIGLGLIAVVGDLAASLIKRCLDRKDSGAFLPGIGGIFDLIDSLCFSAPLLWGYLTLRGGL